MFTLKKRSRNNVHKDKPKQYRARQAKTGQDKIKQSKTSLNMTRQKETNLAAVSIKFGQS